MTFEPFGKVWDASGVRGFFGEGYWFHKMPGCSFKGSTFVSKTATFQPRIGNMELTKDWKPRRLIPDCIKIKFLKGVVLNSVGLSGPGLAALLAQERWQGPMIISVMPFDTLEAEAMAYLLQIARIKIQGPVALQVNVSCPNTEHDVNPEDILKKFESVDIPVIAKINSTMPVERAMKWNVDGICISNSLPYGSDGIFWEDYWGIESPLAKYGGGGLSGKPLLAFTRRWVMMARGLGYKGHINAGGGILCKKDVDQLAEVGADSIFIGSVAILRGWRVAGIIKHAQKVL